MSSPWLLALLLVPLFSSIAFSQKLINGFTREFAIQGLPTGFSLKSFDVTGDSVSELFVLTSNQLQVFDGVTFSMIFKDSAAPGTANLSPTDVNGDGNMDLVASLKDTAVIVWYGPDFSGWRVFSTPRTGFGAFAVRNKEDGQVEFSFGFGDKKDTVEWTCYETRVDGYILQYIDTTFVFSDSIRLAGSPFQMKVVEATGVGSRNLLVFENDIYSYQCSGFYTQSDFIVIVCFLPQVANVTSFGAINGSGLPPCPSAFFRANIVGNIDDDSSAEFILFFDYYSGCSPTPHHFETYDILTGVRQWSRTDLFSIGPLLTVDLNGDGIQELLSYEIQNANPGLAEYRTSDGASLGFTELPFTPSTILTGLFGNPPAPKVLLGHGDSVVVYRIGCAANKGDMNADGNVTVFDVTLELNCVFLGIGSCGFCFADVNCDGVLSASDVVLELLAVFLQRPFPCS